MSDLALLGGKPMFTAALETYPRPLGDELDELRRVLDSGRWNVCYGPGAAERLEEEVCRFTGSRHAVAVNTGGMALQMALRALGVVPGDEVLVQVDTCTADANAIMNAQAAPVFVDSDRETFGLDRTSLEAWITPRSKVLVPVHMWGRPDDMDSAADIGRRHRLIILEDACLALGAQWRGTAAGRLGAIGCFSFGCMKSLQAGEGGMIVTDDDALCGELRMLRSWGDTCDARGARDQRELAWNGRPSQFVCAVALAQLRRFPGYLARLAEGAARLDRLIEGISGARALPRDPRITREAFTKYRFRLDEAALGCSCDAVAAALEAEGIPSIWHVAFEPANTLSLWRSGRWRTWITRHADPGFLARNYAHTFGNALFSFNHGGMTISRDVLAGPEHIQRLAADAIAKVCERGGELADWERRQTGG